jgi:hypothetical protein
MVPKFNKRFLQFLGRLKGLSYEIDLENVDET